MVGKQQRAKAIDCPRNEDTCDVTYFVRKRRIVMIEAGKQVRRRHRNAVGGRLVVGLIPLMTEHCREHSKEGVELQLAAFGLYKFKRGGRVEALRKILDLIG